MSATFTDPTYPSRTHAPTWTNRHAVEFLDAERELMHSTKAADAMAEKYGVTWRTVYSMMQKRGLHTRSERLGVPGLMLRLRLIIEDHPAATDDFIASKMVKDCCDARVDRETAMRAIACVRGNVPFRWAQDGEKLSSKFMSRKSHALCVFIRRAMIERGLKIEAVEKLTGIKHSTIAKILAGNPGSSVANLLLICKGVGIQIEFSDHNGHLFDPFSRAHVEALIDEMGGPHA